MSRLARKKRDTREWRRTRRHLRVRRRVRGRPGRLRLVVHRSLRNIEGQLVDDLSGRTIVGLSSRATPVREAYDPERDGRGKVGISRATGRCLAERAREAGIEQVVFDRGGYKYHGRVKALAEGARQGGLKF